MYSNRSLPDFDQKSHEFQRDTALKFLRQDGAMKWPETSCAVNGGTSKYRAHTAILLAEFLRASFDNNGYLLQIFWEQLSKCNDDLAYLIGIIASPQWIHLKRVELESFLWFGQDGSLSMSQIKPILKMAKDLFLHLGMAVTNTGAKSKIYTRSEILEGIQTNLQQEVTLGIRCTHPDVLERDGPACLLTGLPFKKSWGKKGWLIDSLTDNGIKPQGAHIIPNAIYSSKPCLIWIAALAGLSTAYFISASLNTSSNIMYLQADAHSDFDDLLWGIEAQRDGEKVFINPDLAQGTRKTRYFYRRLPYNSSVNHQGPGLICLKNGDEIEFGAGLSEDFRNACVSIGPAPEFCNLHLTVAHIMHQSRVGP